MKKSLRDIMIFAWLIFLSLLIGMALIEATPVHSGWLSITFLLGFIMGVTMTRAVDSLGEDEDA